MDCSKVIDYSLECKRMCDYYTDKYPQGCDYCPFGKLSGACAVVRQANVTLERIDLVQKWSDTHPRIVDKITLQEKAFLETLDDCYKNDRGFITRYMGKLIFYDPNTTNKIFLNPKMFPFIDEEEQVLVEQLLTYELR